MKKSFGIGAYLCALLLAGYLFASTTINGNNVDSLVSAEQVDSTMLIPGGIPVGLYMDTSGVMVIGTEHIENIDGEAKNYADNIVKEGDYITSINGVTVESKGQLVDEVAKLTSDEVILGLRRQDANIEVKIHGIQIENGAYRLGIWVRDNIQGLGTLTYIDSNSNFGSLGHGIYDIDTNELLEIKDGELYNASISDIVKGEVGAPGGIEGIIIYNPFNKIGAVEMNSNYGVYGKIENLDSLKQDLTPLPMAQKNEVKVGPAEIRCTIDEELETYDIELVEIDGNKSEWNKRIVIQITDWELIEETGGIVQGMSGSPIIQDGKIVGAITHVYVNDPTKGYGILIEDMLAVAESAENIE